MGALGALAFGATATPAATLTTITATSVGPFAFDVTTAPAVTLNAWPAAAR